MKDIQIQPNTQERFDEKYVPDPMSGCWLWTDCVDNDGYGWISVNSKQVKAHRLSVKLSGREIAGKVVRHKCDNPGCVNPDHLETGSIQDNMDDRVQRDRQSKGESHGMSRFTDEDIRRIRSVAVSGIGGNIKALAEQYNTHFTTINRIVKRKSWTHI